MSSEASIVTNINVRDYFQAQLAASITHQHITVDPLTVNYLANLLTNFADSERFFAPGPEGRDVKPLALQYADAVYADGPNQRNLALKRLGDVALFVAGVFAGSLARKLVDVDYYVAMGSGAYRSLNELKGGGFAGGIPYAELGTKFAAFVDVLAEVAEESNLGRKRDLLRDYEIWLHTGSARSFQKLQREGLQPVRSSASFTRH